MAKSRRFNPGDSVPDFSHLSDHDQEPDEPDWSSSDDSEDPADGPASSPPSQSAPSPPPQKTPPPPADQEAPAGPEATADADAGESHVFFDTDEPLDKEELGAATTAFIDPDAAEALPPLVDEEEADTEAASEPVNPLEGLPQADPPGPSDVEFPSFEEPADPGDDATATTDEPAAESGTEPEQPAAMFTTPPDAEEDAPLFPGPGDVEEAEGPVFAAGDESEAVPDFAGIVTESAEHAALPEFAASAVSEPSTPAPVEESTEQRPSKRLAAKATDEQRRRRKKSGKSGKDRSSSRPPASRAKRSAARPAASEPEADPADDRRRLMLILLASYASAVTLACLWMWLSRNSARPHDLESLPDVAPLDANEFRYAPQNASMPRGHTLPLGSGQQLGYIRVEPLRVTRGPVEFVHYSDASQSRPPSEPVLKLWLKFTNVSSDQKIAPLDAALLLTRHYTVETDTVQANQLVLSAADKSAQKPAYVLDHPVTSDWDMVGQQLGRRLNPGESLETYIPLEPGTDAQLTGDLLWRVHFRKGYHDATGRGVTTMIEVPFALSDIQSETSSS